MTRNALTTTMKAERDEDERNRGVVTFGNKTSHRIKDGEARSGKGSQEAFRAGSLSYCGRCYHDTFLKFAVFKRMGRLKQRQD